MQNAGKYWLILLMLLGGGVAAWYYFSETRPPAPIVVPEPSAPSAVESTAPRYPVPGPRRQQQGERDLMPLPPLDDSDSYFALALIDLLGGKDWQREQPIFWEHEGNSAIRLGQWKLVRQHGQEWELYDMEADRTELNDLRLRNVDVALDLKHQYAAWAKSVGVRDWAQLQAELMAAWGIE